MKQYYYTEGHEKHGPFSLEELKRKEISRNTLVWYHPMEKWLKAEQFPELEELFFTDPPPIHTRKSQQHARTQGAFYEDKPPHSWLVESILVTIFCCVPFGIVGIIYAAKVETRYNSGDMEGALRCSREAKKWTLIGFISTLGIVILYFLFIGFIIAIDQ